MPSKNEDLHYGDRSLLLSVASVLARLGLAARVGNGCRPQTDFFA